MKKASITVDQRQHMEGLFGSQFKVTVHIAKSSHKLKDRIYNQEKKRINP